MACTAQRTVLLRCTGWSSNAVRCSLLSLLRRLYLGHVHRAKGRTVSLHHISKCGGTTMCQLAASNRCSNPHLSQEKNCVLNDRCAPPHKQTVPFQTSFMAVHTATHCMQQLVASQQTARCWSQGSYGRDSTRHKRLCLLSLSSPSSAAPPDPLGHCAAAGWTHPCGWSGTTCHPRVSS